MSASLPQVIDLVYQDWATYIGSASPYALGNEDPLDPATGRKLDEGTAPWYRVSVREDGGGRANLNGVVGARRFERLATLSVQCFAPVNRGDQAAATMAEDARAYFEDRRLNNDVIYLNATIRPQPPDGRWAPVLMEVAIEFTEFK